jgi:hypothetical protein
MGEQTPDGARPGAGVVPVNGAAAAGGLLQAAPALARIAGHALVRTASFTLGGSARTGARIGARIVQAALSGENPAHLFTEVGTEVRDQARQLLGIGDLEELVRSNLPQRIVPVRVRSVDRAGPPVQVVEGGLTDGPSTAEALRERGAELLRQSADVRFAEETHPAYARILGEITPDEARILRFMAASGPQPAVDVRTGRPLTMGSELVAPGLSMIGAQAGCRHVERVPSYLHNLYRLGLIWFSREPVKDRLRYQVLEAQPDVQDALKRAGHGRTVRRSIHLTPFGADFCTAVLPESPSENPT